MKTQVTTRARADVTFMGIPGLPTATDQQPPQTSRAHLLSNLRGVSVWVNDHAATAEQAGLRAGEIRAFAEVMLKIAHIPVLEQIDGAEAQPRLHITIQATKVSDLFSVHIDVELLEWVRVLRMPSEKMVGDSVIDAPTWHAHATFVSNRRELREASKEQLGKLLSNFMNDYVSANGV